MKRSILSAVLLFGMIVLSGNHAFAETRTKKTYNTAKKQAKSKSKKAIHISKKLGSFTPSGQKLMDRWAAKALLSEQEPFCWKGKTGLASNFWRNTCKAGYTFLKGRCYGSCPSGYKAVGTLCHIKGCPKGWKWDNVFKNCFKGPLFKRKVKKGRLPRTNVPAGCPANHRTTIASCVPLCPKGYKQGIFRICIEQCPKSRPVECGGGCAKTKADCGLAVAGMIAEPLYFVIDTAITIISAGGAKPALLALKSSVKKLGQNAAKSIVQSTMKKFIGNLAKSLLKSVGKHVVETLVKNFAKKALTESVRRHVATKLVERATHTYASSIFLAEFEKLGTSEGLIDFVIGFEPTGISDLVTAFKYPSCQVDPLPDFPKDICKLKRFQKMKKVTQGPLKCPGDGFFDLYKGGTCWSCPIGAKRTLAGITSRKACVIPRHNRFKPAKVIGNALRLPPPKNAPPSMGYINKCLKGKAVYWKSPSNKCITCPSGYAPRSAGSRSFVENGDGCQKEIAPEHSKATLLGKPGYVCSEGYTRNLSYTWSHAKACERLVTCK